MRLVEQAGLHAPIRAFAPEQDLFHAVGLDGGGIDADEGRVRAVG